MAELMVVGEKSCTRCGVVKPLPDFNRMSASRDGRRPDCKLCHRASQKAKRAGWDEARRKEVNAYTRRYYRVHRGECLERDRRYVERRREVDPEAVKGKDRRYYQKLKEQNRHLDDWYERRARKAAVYDEYVDRRVVYERDEGVCGICGKEVDVNDFHVDHIVPLSRGGRHNYDNVQVAHASCNLAKNNRLGCELEEVTGWD